MSECKACHYYYSTDTRIGSSRGECRRYPPQLVALPGPTEDSQTGDAHLTASVFPVVLSGQECGEFIDASPAKVAEGTCPVCGARWTGNSLLCPKCEATVGAENVGHARDSLELDGPTPEPE